MSLCSLLRPQFSPLSPPWRPQLFVQRMKTYRRLSSTPLEEDKDLLSSLEMEEDQAPPKRKWSKAEMLQNKEIIGRILGVDAKLVKKAPRKLIQEDLAAQVFSLLQTQGFSNGEILARPKMFSMTPWAVENYIEILKESLVHQIALPYILNFRRFHFKPVSVLVENGISPPVPDIARNYFEILKIEKNAQVVDAVWNSLPVDTSRVTLRELRQLVLAQYLIWRLDCDKALVEAGVPRYPRMSHRCFQWIKESLDVLINVGGFEGSKIMKHLYLLSGNPRNTLDILQNVKSLSGMDARHLLYTRPKILMSPKSSLLEIQELFNIHKIPIESVQKYPELYTLSPTTLKERLDEFDTIPEFRPYKNHTRVSRLIYYQNKAKKRLEDFRKSSNTTNGTLPSLHILSSDTGRYEKHMQSGEKGKGVDFISFLVRHFNATKAEIRANMTRHKHWLSANIINAKESLQFIESFNVFTKSQIISALPILIYPKEKIQTQFDNVLASKEAELKDDFFLHMVLYFLEKEVHFSGDGIWEKQKQDVPKYADTEVHHDPEEEDHDHESHDEDHDHEDEGVHDDEHEDVFRDELSSVFGGDRNPDKGKGA